MKERKGSLCTMFCFLQDEAYKGRKRVGSFSAASNVTGRKSDIQAIALLLHQHDAYACFDYAAAGPYVEIDMNPSGRPGAHIDAIFLSMHKVRQSKHTRYLERFAHF
jgi:selenocysteine lyase/cysteine desulfurase